MQQLSGMTMMWSPNFAWQLVIVAVEESHAFVGLCPCTFDYMPYERT